MSRHATGLLVLALLVSRYAVEARPVADPAYVSSFSQLEHAFISGMSAVAMISHKKITFDRQLHVRSRTMMSVESEHRATLSGGDVVRLFVLHNESTLSLRGVNLVQGHPTDDLNGSFGGAIFIHSGSELRLNSVQISTNRASFGGAVYAVRSRITATGCTLTSNTAAESGGAIHAVSSTVIMTDCTVTSNSAARGGAVHTEGDSVVYSNGTIELSHSAFESNVASNGSGVGISNLGGQVQCRGRRCLPVCSFCRENAAGDDGSPPSPTRSPGTMRLLSSRTEKGSAKTFDATTLFAAAFLGSTFAFVVLLLVGRRRRIRNTCKDCCATAGIVDDDATLESALLDALIDPSAHPAEVLSWGDVHLTVRAAVVDHEGYNNACSGASTGTEIEAVLTTQPLIAHDNNGHDAAVAPNKDTTVSLIRQLVDTSNELTFVVDQTMRIVAWSPGKYSSARLGVLITLPLRFHKQDS
jgi:predicted outer membrane repeat protein